MILISFILPVFGVEKYIAACLDSIYAQDLSEEDYEVICVNDASPDHSRDIVLEFRKKHPNLVLVEHDVNKKLGGARNTGLRMAKGRYIWFVDTDDIISTSNATSLIISVCEQNQLDILCFNYTILGNDGEIKDNCFRREMPVMTGLSFIKSQFGKELVFHMGYVWRAVYKRSLLLQNDIWFIENLPWGEDTTYMMRAIAKADRVSATSDALYCYRQTESQITARLYEGKGELIYYSTIYTGEMIVRWRNEVAEKSISIAESLDWGLPWFVHRLFIRLIKTSHKQRLAFYSLARKTPPSKSLRHYMNLQDKIIVNFPLLGLVILDLLSVAYRIKHA